MKLIFIVILLLLVVIYSSITTSTTILNGNNAAAYDNTSSHFVENLSPGSSDLSPGSSNLTQNKVIFPATKIDDYTVKPNLFVNNNQIKSINVKSTQNFAANDPRTLSYCKDQCNNTAGCAGFTIDHRNNANVCYFFKQNDISKNSSTIADTDTYIRQTAVDVIPPTEQNLIQRNELKGCWRDDSYRTLQTSLGRVNSADECGKRAEEQGFNMYAVQYNGQCFAGFNQKYDRIGQVSPDREPAECYMGGRQLGGAWTQYVYAPKQDERLGCWQDDPSYNPLPNFLGETTDLRTCASLAKSKGFNIYAMQDANKCYGGKDTDFNSNPIKNKINPAMEQQYCNSRGWMMGGKTTKFVYKQNLDKQYQAPQELSDDQAKWFIINNKSVRVAINAPDSFNPTRFTPIPPELINDAKQYWKDVVRDNWNTNFNNLKFWGPV